MRIEIKVDELDCMDEVKLLRGELESRPGIEGLEFDVVRGIVQVRVHPDGPTGPQILAWIRQLGMTPQLSGPSLNVADTRSVADKSPAEASTALPKYWDWWVGGLALVAGTVIQLVQGASWIEVLSHADDLPVNWAANACYLVTLVLGLRRIIPRAWASLRQRRADMHVLMCVAVIGAVLIQQWLEAAIVTWLFVLALLLESRSVRRARDAIGDLLNLAPPQARQLSEDGQSWVEVPVEQVARGDTIQVRPGDRFSLDGRVIGGEADVDQAPITGESQPVSKRTGDVVYAGTINLSGTLTVEVTRPSSDSTVAHIVRLVRQAQQQRGTAQRWVDRFAEVYTPCMMIISLLLFVVPPLTFGVAWNAALYNSLVVLVIACPCALVISTPVTIVAALTRAARRGVLIKSGAALERLVSIDTVLLDKTGTLTTGTPRVVAIRVSAGHNETEVLGLAAQLEAGSSHPIATAIQSRWEQETSAQNENGVPWQTRIVPGAGIQTVDQEPVRWIGNEHLAREHGVSLEAIRQHGCIADAATCLWVGRADQLLGSVTLADQTRADACQALGQLAELGVVHVEMLTGDAAGPADRIAVELELQHWQSRLLPQDKSQRVRELSDAGGQVCMVGDGINDSVALAAADVSFAMANQGADVALEAADIALMGQHLTRVPWSIGHARRALKLVKQNIALALGTKLVFLLLAALGYATLWMAIAADMGTSLVVIANALRILRPVNGEVD